jgi:CsoR family transcriptional regulator, copper-sensing transcriptional repressor
MPTSRSTRKPLANAAAESSAAACSCGVQETEGGRKAVAVDPGIKERNLNRLRRLEGQVRGIQRMIEEDRYCADILTQVSSVQEALRGVSRELMRNHLKHCAASAIQKGEPEAEAMYDELVDMMYKSIR